jgi:stearoyl-CoA desaturase (delta-9 desaturase)
MRKRRERFGRERTRFDRARTLFFIILIHTAPIAAIATGTRRADWIAFAMLYFVFALATGIALHRYFAHASFATSRVFQFIMGFAACATFVDPISFAGKHRLHHKHSDTPRDVHSPREGFWFCWYGSLIDEGYSNEEITAMAKDLWRYPELVWLHKNFLLPGLSVWALMFALGGFSMFAIGYCLSIALVLNLTSALNYVCHRWGYRRYPTSDGSTNNVALALLTLGEGWHNNHHHAPTSARAGHAWWEMDFLYWIIRLLAACRLVWNVRRFPPTILPHS